MISYSFIPNSLVGTKEIVDSGWYATNRLNLLYTFLRSRKSRDLRKEGHDERWYAMNQYAYNEDMRFVLNLSWLMDGDYKAFYGKDMRPNIYHMKDVPLFDATKRLNITATLHTRIPNSAYASAFAQVGYYGSDPYNTYYNQSIYFFRFGLGWAFFITADHLGDFY
jgi:hypothetical protein